MLHGRNSWFSIWLRICEGNHGKKSEISTPASLHPNLFLSVSVHWRLWSITTNITSCLPIRVTQYFLGAIHNGTSKSVRAVQLFSLVYMHILFSKSSIPTWYIRTIMQCMLQCMHYPKVIHVLLYKTLLNFWCVPAPNPQVPDIIFFVIRIYIPLYSIIHIHNNTLLGPPT